MTSFETAATVLGALLVGGALLSGLARRSFLSLTAVFVLAGLMLGQGGFEVLEIDPRSAFVEDLALVALVLILFRDGLEVEGEMLQRAWHLPLRNLVLAMPITCGIVAVTAKALTDLSWTEAFLVGALLSPTDPVLSSSVVNNPRVPRVIRHSLNLESGLNDGLALPAVLALLFSLVTFAASLLLLTQPVGLGPGGPGLPSPDLLAAVMLRTGSRWSAPRSTTRTPPTAPSASPRSQARLSKSPLTWQLAQDESPWLEESDVS